MNSFLEDPKPIIFIGIVAGAILASIVSRTERYRLVFLAMLGVLLLTVAGVVVERVVVTEKEEVEAIIYGAADAMEDNDVDRVLEYVTDSARRTKTSVRSSLEQIVVVRVKIRNLQIVINKLTSPPTAEARFDGVLYFRMKDSPRREWYPARLFVELRLEEGRWVITDHLEHEIQRL